MDIASTLQEYLTKESELQAQAKELFPYEFSKCSYDQGYVKQQVYSCLDCYETDKEFAGLCYSCSIACHGEHRLVELFDRRAFRCDCATPRTKHVCSLQKPTETVNELNKYNDNFRNIFCYCRKEYDPVNETGTMYQCVLCEDWFHDTCIANEETLPHEDLFNEYICRKCTKQEAWLLKYETRSDVAISTDDRKPIASEQASDGKRKATDDLDKRPSKRPNSAHENCSWASLPELPDDKDRSLFLLDDFRDKLCRCENCQARMAHLPALLAEEDVYEPPTDSDLSGDETNTEDVLQSVLNSMPREKAIEGVLALGSLKQQIMSYLRPLAERGEIVTKEHVEQFFDQRKRE